VVEVLVFAGFTGAIAGLVAALGFQLTLSRRLRSHSFELEELNSRLLRVVRRNAAQSRWEDSDTFSTNQEQPLPPPIGHAGLLPAEFAARKFKAMMGGNRGAKS